MIAHTLIAVVLLAGGSAHKKKPSPSMPSVPEAALAPTEPKPAPPPAPAPAAPQVLRVAITDIKAIGDVPARPLAALSQVLAPEVRKLEGVSAIGASEVREMLNLERQKQVLGCTDQDSACIEELAGALNADEILSFELTSIGKRYTLTARRSNARRGVVVGSVSRTFDRADGEELLAVLGPVMETLYPERKLRPGRKRGVDQEVVRRLNPPPLPAWVFYGTGAASIAALATGGALGFTASQSVREFDTLAQASLTQPQPATVLQAIQQRAESQAFTANTLFLAAGGLAAVAVVEALFTDWRNDRATLEVAPVISLGGSRGAETGFAVGGTF